MSKPTPPLADLYRLCLTAEKPGLLGAPTFHIALLVHPSGNSVSGVVHITQAVTPPNGSITVNVTGTIHELVFGAQITKVIVISGTYIVRCLPPALCLYQEHFTATIAFHGNDWTQGSGNFHWANNTDNNVPTKSVPC
jgi:hypothetical protein